MDYVLQEGSLSLPDGYIDRSVNMFTFGASVPAPLSITIARDSLGQGEPLSDYVERQLRILASKLPGYTHLGSHAVSLSIDKPIPGIQVDGWYMSQGRPLYQRQAVFLLNAERALIFSASAQDEFSATQNQDWANLLAGFTPAAEQE